MNDLTDSTTPDGATPNAAPSPAAGAANLPATSAVPAAQDATPTVADHAPAAPAAPAANTFLRFMVFLL